MANKAINDLLKYGIRIGSFIRPNLASNGTLGGTSFAVSASNSLPSYDPYKAVDSNSPYSFWSSQASSVDYIFYNPNMLKVSQMTVIGGDSTFAYYTLNVYGSNDGVSYSSSIHTQSISGGNYNTLYTITIPEANRGFYKYYKMNCVKFSGATVEISNLTITAEELLI